MTRSTPFAAVPRKVLLGAAALSASGATMLMAGVLALTQPTLLPALGAPSIAWPLVVVGGLLDAAAVSLLLGALRAARAA
ncbi:MAG: hypothetical protein IPG43_22845 [Proteobacteria bacterium]|nr:hypothetical protein [Pseudomonadota bacterium]